MPDEENTAPESEPDAPSESAGVDIDSELDPEEKYFDRDYVEKIRQEAGKYRTQWAPYRDAFDGYNEEETQFLLNVVETLKTDINAGGRQLRDLAASILQDEFLEGTKWEQQVKTITDPEPEGDDEDRPLTRKEWEALMEERDSQRRAEEEKRAAGVKQIQSEAAKLGFEPNTERYYKLIEYAAKMTDGDLQAAANDINKLYPEATEPEPDPGQFPKTAGAPKVSSPTLPEDDELADLPPLKRASAKLEARLAAIADGPGT